MTEPPRFLRQDVRAEPLVDRWYAWTQLIPPVTAALHAANAHVPILRSYLADPRAHVEAARGGTPLGAPIIGHDRPRPAEIQRLLDDTLARRGDQLELAAAVAALDELLRREARGGCLDELYGRVPAALRGLVELGYDREHRPSARFLEPLLYRSRFHHPDAQGLALGVVTGPDRPSALSTPRLPGDEALWLPLPFAAPAIDELFAMKRAARPPGEAAAALGLRDREALARFEALLTDRAPERREPWRGPGMRIRYFGHASLSLEWPGAAVLIDPVIHHRPDGEPRRWFSFADLPEVIDWVLITHGHEDHLHLETLLELRHRVRAIAVPRSGGGLHDPSLAMLLRAVGFREVREVDELDRVPCAGGGAVAVPFFGEHGDLAVRAKTGWLVEGGGRRALCVADSDNVEPRLYERVREAVGGADALFVGMECEGSPVTSLYGPLFTAALDPAHREARRFRGSDSARALDLVRRFGCGEAYVYAMGLEPWLYYLMSLRYDEASRPIVESDRFVEECRRSGVRAERLHRERELVLR